jgi:hypothetical protein
MKNILLLTSILILFSSCEKDNNPKMKESPLAIVIKLKSAEALINFEEAKKYIDLKRVFEKITEPLDAEEEWKKINTFFHSLGTNKKFTGQFKYFNYKINEIINKSNATVTFTSINKDAQIKKISNYSALNIAIVLKAANTFCPFLMQVSVTERITA